MSKNDAYDRFGRVLQEGDVVHLLNRSDIMWKVQGVKPVLTTNAPPGTVELSLVAIFVTGVPGGQPLGDLIKVRDVAEVSQPAAEIEES